jgi:hypothetical protein
VKTRIANGNGYLAEIRQQIAAGQVPLREMTADSGR